MSKEKEKNRPTLKDHIQNGPPCIRKFFSIKRNGKIKVHFLRIVLDTRSFINCITDLFNYE